MGTRAPQLESNLRSPQLEKSPHSNKDPVQPKRNKYFLKNFLDGCWNASMAQTCGGCPQCQLSGVWCLKYTNTMELWSLTRWVHRVTPARASSENLDQFLKLSKPPCLPYRVIMMIKSGGEWKEQGPGPLGSRNVYC